MRETFLVGVAMAACSAAPPRAPGVTDTPVPVTPVTTMPRVLLVATTVPERDGTVIAPLGCPLGVGNACLALLHEGLEARAADGRVFRLGPPMRAWNCHQDPEEDSEPDFDVFESDVSLRSFIDEPLLVTGGDLPVMSEPDARSMIADLDRDGVPDRISNYLFELALTNGRTGLLVRVKAIAGVNYLRLIGVVDVEGDGPLELVFREGGLYRAVSLDGRAFKLEFGCLFV